MPAKKRTRIQPPTASATVSVERIERRIHVLRGERVMLDEDLAGLYGVGTKRLNEQVTRNSNRFPADFAFRLSQQEFTSLRSQNATANWGKKRYPPRAFTEHGAVMAASVLNTPVAVAMSLQVVRAFVRMRELLLTHRDLARKLADLEKTVGGHDRQIRAAFEAIRQLLEARPPHEKRPRIGFA